MIPVCTDRSRWCSRCALSLEAGRPAAPLFGRLLCLECAQEIVKALETEVAEQAESALKI